MIGYGLTMTYHHLDASNGHDDGQHRGMTTAGARDASNGMLFYFILLLLYFTNDWLQIDYDIPPTTSTFLMATTTAGLETRLEAPCVFFFLGMFFLGVLFVI